MEIINNKGSCTCLRYSYFSSFSLQGSLTDRSVEIRRMTFETTWSKEPQTKKHAQNRILNMYRRWALNYRGWKTLMPHFHIQVPCSVAPSGLSVERCHFWSCFNCLNVYAFSIFWRSRSSRCVRAPIFYKASSNIIKPSSGQSQPMSPFPFFVWLIFFVCEIPRKKKVEKVFGFDFVMALWFFTFLIVKL